MTPRRDQLIELLEGCPPESLRWAATGYSLALEDHDAYRAGYRAAATDMERTWRAAIKPVRATLTQPTHAELQQRRGLV